MAKKKVAAKTKPTVTVEMRRDVPRGDITLEAGEAIAEITFLRDDVNLNLLVDAIRNGFAKERKADGK